MKTLNSLIRISPSDVLGRKPHLQMEYSQSSLHHFKWGFTIIVHSCCKKNNFESIWEYDFYFSNILLYWDQLWQYWGNIFVKCFTNRIMPSAKFKKIIIKLWRLSLQNTKLSPFMSIWDIWSCWNKGNNTTICDTFNHNFKIWSCRYHSKGVILFYSMVALYFTIFKHGV